MQASSSQSLVVEVCDLVKSHYFRQDPALEQWHRRCLDFAAEASSKITPHELAIRTNAVLEELKSSHLSIFSPEEDQEIWLGSYKTHGITFLNVDGRFFVQRLFESSPAFKLGVRFADELTEVNSQKNLVELDLNNSEGWFKFKRNEKDFLVNLVRTEFTANENPVIEDYNKFSVLVIPSFRKEFFERESLNQLLERLKSLKKPWVLDLRQNQGGSVVAMLRLASSLFCKPTSIGELNTATKENFKEIQDDLRDEFLIQDVNHISKIYLETFVGYSCIQKPKAIWVGSQTMSVSEILVDALKNKFKIKILGQRTAGRVVVGVWYSLATWPKGFTLSVPQANFTNALGNELESIGVLPDEVVDYKLIDLVAGKDSFVVVTEKQL